MQGVNNASFQNATNSLRKHSQKLNREKYLDEASVRLDSLCLSSESKTHDKNDEHQSKYDSPEIIKRILHSKLDKAANSSIAKTQISCGKFNVRFLLKLNMT